MALVTFPGGLWIPHRQSGADAAASSFIIDAADEKLAFIIQAPKSGTINKVAWRTGTVTTGATMDVRIETVSLVTGDPTGTLLAGGNNGAQVVADTDDNTWFTTTLTTGAVVHKGDFIAIVIVNPTVSPGNMILTTASLTNDGLSFPYVDHFTGSWSKNSSALPSFALEYSDGSYPIIRSCIPYATFPSISIGSGTSLEEAGLKFSLDMNVRCCGFWFKHTVNQDMTVSLIYHDGMSVLESLSLEGTISGNPGRGRWSSFYFATPKILVRDVFYRLILTPTAGTPQIQLSAIDFPSEAIMGSFDSSGSFHYTSRGDGGAWTDITTRYPMMGIIADQVDAVGT